MQVQTYATFEEMFGRKSTLDELIRDLKHFSRWSVLFTCSIIGIILNCGSEADGLRKIMMC